MIWFSSEFCAGPKSGRRFIVYATSLARRSLKEELELRFHAGNENEVAIPLKQRQIEFDRYGCDQAIVRRADREPCYATPNVKRGCLACCRPRVVRYEQRQLSKNTIPTRELFDAVRTLEYLLKDGSDKVDRLFAF